MATTRTDVTPNRRGARSREIVLDAAERVMAAHGYEAATVARIVEESGIPMSSVYHYFGSKDGVLLAVMERGAERFFQAVPEVTERLGEPTEHLALALTTVHLALDEHPDFLRLVVVMATQPVGGEGAAQVHEVVSRVRDTALERLRRQMALIFGIKAGSRAADRLARFVLATIDGAFVAQQADPQVTLEEILEHLPEALVAIHRSMTA